MATTTANVTATALPLREAAARMGMSTDTLRKRLQRGLTPGRKVDGQWFVVPDGAPDVSVSVQDAAGPVHDQTGPVPDSQDAPPGPPGALLVSQRAQEMAEYTERLLAPWRAIVQQQAEEIGGLKAQLAASMAAPATNGVAHPQDAHGQAVEASTPPETESAPSPERGARRWWQRAWVWLNGPQEPASP
jgi:hypothetical protein